MINCVIGEVLGYNKERRLHVKPQALGGNSNVQVAVERGDIDIGIGVPSFGLPIIAKGEWGSRSVLPVHLPLQMGRRVQAELADQDATKTEGQEDRRLRFGGTEYPVTRNVLKSLGIDPDNDVKWVAVGNGCAGRRWRWIAGRSTRWPTTTPASARSRRPEIEPPIPATPRQSTDDRRTVPDGPEAMVKNDPKLPVGVGRSVDKASRFLLANPEAGAEAFLKMVPQAAPRGASEDRRQGYRAVDHATHADLCAAVSEHKMGFNQRARIQDRGGDESILRSRISPRFIPMR